MRLLLLIIILFTNFSIALSGTIDPNIPDQKYIDYGSKFKCVIKICGNYTNKTKFCASVVAIKPNCVITAAHVVKDYNEATIIDNDGEIYKVTKVIINDSFEKGKSNNADIALCYLDRSLKLDFYPELYKKQDEVGKVCSMSGYGITGNFITGAYISDSKKRAGSNIIDKIYNDLLICSPSTSSSKNRTSLEYLIASGDSGGGLFIDKKLAGINSSIITNDNNTNSDYGDESGHTRISLYIEWIEDNTK